MELSTSPKAPNGLTGRELLPLLQPGVGTGIGALLAEIGSLPRGAMALSRVNYTADTAGTADADPGAGKLRWNNAAQASATEIYIDDVDADAVDHSALWATTNTGGNLYLFNPANLSVWQQWSLTSVTDAAGYAKLGVTLTGSSGSFADTDDVVLSLQQPNPVAGTDRSTVTTINHIADGAVTFDYSLGDYFIVNLAANVTSSSFSNPPAGGHGGSVRIDWIQDVTGSRTVVLPTGNKAIDGSDTAVQSAANSRTISHWTSIQAGRWDYTMKAATP
jgi:hypothetical protein